MKRACLTAVAFALAAVVVYLIGGNWGGVAFSVALLSVQLTQLFSQQAGKNGGRLSRAGLALILSSSTVALSLVSLAVTTAEDDVALILQLVIVVCALGVVIPALVRSHRRTLGRDSRPDAS